MTARRLICSLTLLGLIATVAGAPQTRPANGGNRRGEWDNFRILTERNVFLKNRTSPRSDTPRAATGPVGVRDPDNDLVLVGVVRHENGDMAFIENVRSGEVQVLRKGHAAGKGKITALTLDRIVYSRNGSTISVEIGCALGGSFSASQGATTALGGEAAESVGTSKPSDSSQADILERMRQRREQELSK